MADTVMIGCKAPNGLVLNLDRSEKTDDRGGSRIIRGATVTLKGWAHRFNRPDPTEDQGGYALTAVPTEFWDAWLKSHEDSTLLADKIIIGPHRDARGQATALADVPKMFGPASMKDVSGIKQLEMEQ